jgi:hypothetical protein
VLDTASVFVQLQKLFGCPLFIDIAQQYKTAGFKTHRSYSGIILCVEYLFPQFSHLLFEKKYPISGA